MATGKSSKRSHHIADETGQSMEEAGASSRDMAHRAAEATHQLHDKVSHAGDSVVKYIRREPIKSVLIAAATAAALMALIDLLLRSRRRD